MISQRPRSSDVKKRLQRRLHQRYLRWLAGQEVVDCCLAPSQRRLRRGWRRLVGALSRSRLVGLLVLCLAVVGLLLALAAIGALGVMVVQMFRVTFFLPPEHHFFTGPIQQHTVALTRLAVLQTLTLPLILLWAWQRFSGPAGLEQRRLYRPFRASRLVGYRAGLCAWCVGGAVVSAVAVGGHKLGGWAVLAALVLACCWGYLLWGVGNRLMACRTPPWLAAPDAAGMAACVYGLILIPLITAVCFSATVLTVAQYLRWLGPVGWTYDRLLGFSLGQTVNLLPLLLSGAIIAACGYGLNRCTRSWSFRWRLLTKYRAPAVPRQAVQREEREPQLARDLRRALSQRSQWPLIPGWVRRSGPLVWLASALLFVLQVVLVGIALFLESLGGSAGSALTSHESKVLYGQLVSIPGWNVMLLEVYVMFVLSEAGELELARRPVSVGQMWKQLQWYGVRSAPAQVMLTTPFVLVTVLVAPDWAWHSLLAIAVALAALVAMRTVVCAGLCYFAAVATLRWVKAVLSLAGTLTGVLLWGTIGVGLVLVATPNLAAANVLVTLLLQQVVAFIALGIAWWIWQTVGAK